MLSDTSAIANACLDIYRADLNLIVKVLASSRLVDFGERTWGLLAGLWIAGERLRNRATHPLCSDKMGLT